MIYNKNKSVWLCSNKKCTAAWYYNPEEKPDFKTCEHCGSKIFKSPLTVEEYVYIDCIAEDDREFLDAMIELKQKDIIEFKTKIAQFKAQVDAQEERERQERNLPRCPTCQSTNIHKISTGKRAVSILGFGILSNNIGKTYECLDCKYKW